MNGVTCGDGADPVVEKYFGDCVYTYVGCRALLLSWRFSTTTTSSTDVMSCECRTRDWYGFVVGLCSIVCWLVAQAPQLVENYKTKSADALSPFFLAEWLLGDTTNLIGALLQGEQPQTVIFTAQYFICMDCILLVQYLYYTSMAKYTEKMQVAMRKRQQHPHHHRRPTHRHPHPHHPHRHGDDDGEHHRGNLARDGGQASGGRNALVTLGVAGMGLMVISFDSSSMRAQIDGGTDGDSVVRGMLEQEEDKKSYERLAGSILGYLSCILYLVSRGSQIYKNWKRKSAQGLAASMFAFACSANIFYGISVILRSETYQEFMSSLPWLIGSLGTVFLDLVILLQATVFYKLPRTGNHPEEHHVPLLQQGHDQC